MFGVSNCAQSWKLRGIEQIDYVYDDIDGVYILFTRIARIKNIKNADAVDG